MKHSNKNLKKNNHNVSLSNFSNSVLIIRIRVPNSGGMFGSSYNSSSFAWVMAILMSISLDLFSNHISQASFAPLRIFRGTLGSSIWLITVAICPNLVSMSDMINTCTNSCARPLLKRVSFKVIAATRAIWIQMR